MRELEKLQGMTRIESCESAEPWVTIKGDRHMNAKTRKAYSIKCLYTAVSKRHVHRYLLQARYSMIALKDDLHHNEELYEGIMHAITIRQRTGIVVSYK